MENTNNMMIGHYQIIVIKAINPKVGAIIADEYVKSLQQEKPVDNENKPVFYDIRSFVEYIVIN